jgi:3',5'-cyclic AMP phosphodiesterase CpdA
VKDVRILHLSDVHFGVDAQLAQLEAIEDYAPTLELDAVAVSGDLTQRARHGEFQAAHAMVRRLAKVAPVLVVPGNHDVQWWASPFHLLGTRRLYAKYRRWFGEDLTPTLEIPGAVIAGALSAWGVALGSMTPNLRDLAVKGHLPKREIDRVAAIFAQAPPGAAKVLVLHHNVLPGEISGRMGLAHWKTAQARLAELAPDVVLCGHDHQESAAQVGGTLAVSTASTQTSRTRGGRPSVFNLVRIYATGVEVRHFRWDADAGSFTPSDSASFARSAQQAPVVSVAGMGQP